MRILLTGKNGQVGYELHRTLAPLGHVVAFDRSELDLSKANSIRDRVRDVRPDIIVNAGAYTAVDKAEAEPDLAMSINGVAPGVLAEEAQRLNAFLVHYSTDYVFDGTNNSPYRESDLPNPLNVYGATKLAGEKAIQAVGVVHVILRTSWLYGLRGHNFLLTMLRLAREREELRVVDDQIGAPTWSRSIAEASARILKLRSLPNADNSHRETGSIFHLTASGSTSWYGFAGEIIAQTGATRTRSPKVTPISSKDYVSASKRPKNSLLSNDKLFDTFGFRFETWQTDLRAVLAEYMRGHQAN